MGRARIEGLSRRQRAPAGAGRRALDGSGLRISRELLISDFAAAEVASALSRLVRMALLTVADASARLADFEAWRATMSMSVDIQASDARLAYIYVQRFELGLRAPDALHLAIARRLGVALVTLDRRLAGVGRELGVVIEELEAD